MTEPTGQPEAGSAATTMPDGLVDAADDRADAEAGDTVSAVALDTPEPVRPLGRRRASRRVSGLIAGALLVGAGVFLALRGMQQVVARAPATPVPAAISTPAPTSNQGLPSPTPQPTPMPTSSALILEP